MYAIVQIFQFLGESEGGRWEGRREEHNKNTHIQLVAFLCFLEITTTENTS
jgi:hypothetical protein